MKNKVISAINNNRENIISIGDYILNNPELGYCENNTSMFIKNKLEELGFKCEYPFGVTGVKAVLGDKNKGVNICIIGEMDALRCNGHPYATPEGVAHACGHNAQIAAMLGAAIGLKESNIIDKLGGCITFFAVPAEEFIELEYRNSLKKQGKIQYFGGKQQLIAEGAFDDIDIAIMIHAQPNEENPKIYVRGHNLGFIAKTINIKGKTAHGSTPFYGTNALNAAALSIIGIHSNRETFRDEDKIRIHPIITKGGDVINSVPDDVCIETYVRGATLEAIQKGNNAVERSIAGATQIIGADYEIDDIPGYLPISENIDLSKVFEENAELILGNNKIIYGEEITGSSDIGDLSSIMPVIQPSIGGFKGNLHTKEFEIVDKETAYISSAKILALTAVDLLKNNCKSANQILSNFKPKMNKETYIKYLRGDLNVD